MSKKKQSKNIEENITLDETTELLYCEIPQKEWEGMAQKQSELFKKLVQQENDKKAATKQMSADIDKTKAEINQLSEKVSSRKEVRDAKVLIRSDWGKGMRYFIRQDTKEQIRACEISHAEQIPAEIPDAPEA